MKSNFLNEFQVQQAKLKRSKVFVDSCIVTLFLLFSYSWIFQSSLSTHHQILFFICASIIFFTVFFYIRFVYVNLFSNEFAKLKTTLFTTIIKNEFDSKEELIELKYNLQPSISVPYLEEQLNDFNIDLLEHCFFKLKNMQISTYDLNIGEWVGENYVEYFYGNMVIFTLKNKNFAKSELSKTKLSLPAYIASPKLGVDDKFSKLPGSEYYFKTNNVSKFNESMIHLLTILNALGKKFKYMRIFLSGNEVVFFYRFKPFVFDYPKLELNQKLNYEFQRNNIREKLNALLEIKDKFDKI